MTRYFCFLRAINVGGHTVSMKRLKELFESMGFSNVETFIASGNVIFETSRKNPQAIEKLIFKRLHEALGYEVHAYIRTAEELKATGEFLPFPEVVMNGAVAYHVGFGGEHANPEVEKRIAALSTKDNDLRANGRETYWVIRTRFSDSKLTGALIERSLGAKATFRNINTVKRLIARYPPKNS